MYRATTIATVCLSVLLGSFVTTAIAADNATITGKIIFKGDPKSKKVKRSKINTQKDPNCAHAKKKIGTEKVILNKKTDPITIRNVIVSIKEGLGNKTFPARTNAVTLDQFGCQYKPHVLAIQNTQKITIHNGDTTNHNIHFLPKVNQEMNFTQPKKGMKKVVKLQTEAPFRVKCDVHPWMGAHIAVFNHPFFDVTGKQGTFTLTGLPAGSYVIEAWHETFGKVTANVTVGDGETKNSDITFEVK